MLVSLSIPASIPDRFRDSVAILAWLTACEAAPPWHPPGRPAEPGTPALWCRLARLAVDGGWVRETDRCFLPEAADLRNIVECARDMAAAAGAPSSPDLIEEYAYTTRGGEGTRVALYVNPGPADADLDLCLTGEPASVLRRAHAAQVEIDRWARDLAERFEPEPEPEPEPEIVRRYSAADEAESASEPDNQHPAVGQYVIAPEHLAGARITRAHIGADDDVWLTLDKKHPTEPGYITVGLDYVQLSHEDPAWAALLHGGADALR